MSTEVNVSGKNTWHRMRLYWYHFLVGLGLIFLPLAPVGATPVIMVLGDSLVAGHGLPQGQAFPEILKKIYQGGRKPTKQRPDSNSA